ncbi:MAG: DsbA family protein [Gammaproteobacteria bacterium]|nr:DsbA family protein [Gammaproteobacteria bacterium]MDH5240231.1 DsbA family protein [Gammaproteobacteria bacterium]MDH5261718.1 DsbA family protein [Gammaproteobacteria bacterium]MDH5582774.1 DsbA family protein [Gammaproteobacteria bacterium]
MSRKNRREPSISVKPVASWAIAAVAVLVLVFALGAATFLFETEEVELSPSDTAPRQAALASEHSPSLGNTGARVHIVEFLDPACGTCAQFYPMVKQWMKEAPDELRLSVRHLAFHTGADYAVRILEASRAQDKYWETLETLLATQQRWVRNHVVIQDQVLPAIAGVGLDIDQLLFDMTSDDITRRIERDTEDAVFLKVKQTPEYFVNGRPLPSFGPQQLLDLVREELGKNDE